MKTVINLESQAQVAIRNLTRLFRHAIWQAKFKTRAWVLGFEIRHHLPICI